MTELHPNATEIVASGDLNALNAAAVHVIAAALDDAALHAMDEVRAINESLTALGDDKPDYARTLEHGRAEATARAAHYWDLADVFHRRFDGLLPAGGE